MVVRATATGLGAVITVLLTGCAIALPPTNLSLPHPPPAVIHESWPGCFALGAFATFDAADQPDLGRGSVPAEFTPVAAIRCTPGTTEATARLGWERRATDPTEITALTTYLRQRSQTVLSPDTLACPAVAWWPPWLFLLDADGRWIRPQIAVDACGFARDLWADGGVPYERLTFTDTAVCRSPADEWDCREIER